MLGEACQMPVGQKPECSNVGHLVNQQEEEDIFHSDVHGVSAECLADPAIVNKRPFHL